MLHGSLETAAGWPLAVLSWTDAVKLDATVGSLRLMLLQLLLQQAAAAAAAFGMWLKLSGM